MSSLSVSDHLSNSYEQIEFAVRKLGRSKDRLKVFDFVYRGNKPVKTAAEISKGTGLSYKRVLEEAKILASNGIIKQTKLNKRAAYEKYSFFAAHKEQIKRLVSNPKKLNALPSKRNKTLIQTTEKIIRNAKTKQLFIDDLASFKKVNNVKTKAIDLASISEKEFKNGVQKIIGEKGDFTDWGGEQNDLLTTRMLLNGKRIQTAFAFKGPGTKGKLVPSKMGKNGDQVQRLFKSPGDLFILQYREEIADSIYEQMEAFAKIKSASEQKLIYYCVIDGQDTLRLVSAYFKNFKRKLTKRK